MQSFTTRPELLGSFGMVASTHWLASAVGMSILERGGNAFDAAVAAGFTLQVVEPHLNGPGGEVPILLYSRSEDRVEVICGQGPAPAAATLERFRSLGLDLVPGTGLLPAVVPGAFGAWLHLLREHGSMELEEVLAPAIAYAREGFPVVPNIHRTLERVRSLFETEWTSSAAIWLRDGLPAPGARLRNPVLAATYLRILREAAAADGRERRIEAARRAWYEGFVAEAIDAFCRSHEVMDITGRRHRGLLRGADMAAWRATVEPPVVFEYRGWRVCKTGPWGQGPVALQQLALLDGFDLDRLAPTDPDFVHIVTECAKLAFADREAFYGDPDFVPVPLETLLSRSYNDERRRLVGERASMELRPGSVPGHGAPPLVRIAGDELDLAHAGAFGGGEPTTGSVAEDPPGDEGAPGDTCHVDVVDRWGNMVSATPSGGWLQSSPAIPSLGFALSTRGQMFTLVAGRPDVIAPGKRPRTTLTPSLALGDGGRRLAWGTPGGDQQDQWSLHVFLRHLHCAMNLQQAIDAPEFHSEHFPSSFYPRACRPGRLVLEARFPEAAIEELARRGHDVRVADGWSLGRVSAVARRHGFLAAAANPRFMQGYAVGR